MSDFETILTIVLLIVYGITFYLAGRGNLLELIPKMLQEKLKEIEENIKDDEP